MRAKMGNGFPKMGSQLPLSADTRAASSYETIIAAAIRAELGGSRRAIKTLMRRTGVSARTAKNWLSGTSGPTGVHLVELMRTSDEVFEAVLHMAERETDPPAGTATEASRLLKRALGLLEGRGESSDGSSSTRAP